MDWDAVRYVLAIAREGSLSAAATSLGVTHTTVGRQLRALEESLGVLLFDRTSEGFVPTAAGQDIADIAARMETEVLELEGRVLGRDAQLRGKLRVATMDILLRGAAGLFQSFSARYPSVALTVTTSDSEVSLNRREADVALRMTNTPPGSYVGKRLGRVEFAVYGSKQLVRGFGKHASYNDLPWLHWDERLGLTWLDDWLAEHAPAAQVAMRLDVSSLGLQEAIAAGLGVHFLACFVGDGDSRLVRIGPVADAFTRDVWLLTLAELKHNARVRAFMDHVSSAWQATPLTPKPGAGKGGRRSARTR